MNINLSGKIAIVTGAATEGIGRADAIELGKSGCKVACIDLYDCEDTLSVLKKHGVEAKGYQCDISKMDEVQKTIDAIKTDFGTVDILVNNAGIVTTVGFFTKIDTETWNRDIEVNLIGSANVTRAVWPILLEKKWGRVVFMSSIAGTMGGSGQTSYAATKAGVIGLAKALAIEGGRFNVTVNAVAPGVVGTPAAQMFIRPDMLERMVKRSALNRMCKPEEIASTITFLCSEQAEYITGQVITVDGGTGLFTF